MKLINVYLLAFIGSARPLISAHGSTFIQKQKAVSFPYEAFESVSPFAAEQIQYSGAEDATLILFVYDTRKAFDSVSEIRVAADYVYFPDAVKFLKHQQVP